MASYDTCPNCGGKKCVVAKQCRRCRTQYLRSSEYFWSKIDKKGPADCWNWQAGLSQKGYGIRSTSGWSRVAHRCVWELTYGPIPRGLHVLHKCDNPACCNPKHLFLGTNADNVADRVRKGRGHRGQTHARAKFTEKQIREIRMAGKNGKVNQSELARQYKVHSATINRIIHRGRWAWLPD